MSDKDDLAGVDEHWRTAAELASHYGVTEARIRAIVGRWPIPQNKRMGAGGRRIDPDAFEQVWSALNEEDGKAKEIKDAYAAVADTNKQLQDALKEARQHIQKLYELIPAPHARILEMVQKEAERHETRVETLEKGHDEIMKTREALASEAHARALGDKMWAAADKRKTELFTQLVKPGMALVTRQLGKSFGISMPAPSAAPDPTASGSAPAEAGPSEPLPEPTPEEQEQIEALRLLLRSPGLGDQLEALEETGYLSPYQAEQVRRILKHAPKAEPKPAAAEETAAPTEPEK